MFVKRLFRIQKRNFYRNDWTDKHTKDNLASRIGLCPLPLLTLFLAFISRFYLLMLSCYPSPVWFLDYPVPKQTGDFIPPSGLIDSIPAPLDYPVAGEEFIRVFCPPGIRQDKARQGGITVLTGRQHCILFTWWGGGRGLITAQCTMRKRRPFFSNWIACQGEPLSEKCIF